MKHSEHPKGPESRNGDSSLEEMSDNDFNDPMIIIGHVQAYSVWEVAKSLGCLLHLVIPNEAKKLKVP